MNLIANILIGLATILGGLITIYTWVIVIATVLSWVQPNPYNPIVRTLRAITEPVLYFVRRKLPFVYAAGIDFSPIVVILVLQFINIALVRTLLEFAVTLK